MKITKYHFAVFAIVVVSAVCLLFVIGQNQKRTAENSELINQNRNIFFRIDSAFYCVLKLELSTQKFLLSGDSSFEKEALQEMAAVKETANEIGSNETSNLDSGLFVSLIDKKIRLQADIIRLAKESRSDAAELSAGKENQQLSVFLHQSLKKSKENSIQKVNALLKKSEALNALNFKTSLVIYFGSTLLILFTLFQLFRNKWLRKLAETDTRASETKYKNLVDDSGVGLLTTDLNGCITFINKRITLFTGFEASEVIGKHFSSLIDTEWVQIINEKFKKHFQLKQSEWNMEFPLKVKSGNIIWVEQSSVVIVQNGEARGFQCIIKDITEKRRIEIELRKIEMEKEETQFRLQSILDNTPLIIFIKNLEGKYLLANKTYKEFFQFTEEEIIGKTDFELVSEESAIRYKEIDEYVIQKQKNAETEETVQREGVEKNLLIVKFPLFDKNNNIYGIGGIASDITERHLYGLHLIESKRKAEMAEQLQEQFLANMSHEIRTPMNGIIGMTNILLTTSMSAEQKDFLEVIKKSSDNLLILINDILDLSKIKSGKLRIEKIDFRLRETLENTISAFRVLINEKGLTLRTSVELDVPDSLVGDPHRLNQVLNNLLSNAIKFTSIGEINLEIKTLFQDKNEVDLLFSVSDTGIGISKEKLEYIFESFSQAETGTSRKFGGSGLGLSITKKLIELQNGSIDVTSEPGKGTSFSFKLKYQKAAQAVSIQYGNKKQDSFNEEGLSEKRILVVEDNAANQKVIYHMLSKAGIEADLADNGKVAIQLLEDGFQYDLIIMDLQMPEMDGFETTSYIRQKLELDVPIIAMTASSLRNEKIKCLRLGMNEYMNKPFVPAELFRELRRFLLKKEETSAELNKPVLNNAPSEKLYSLNHLIELDDVDCLCEVLELFLESTPVIMAEIKESIVEENWEEVYKLSHKIKSSLGILQMSKIMSLMSKVESDAKERKNLELIPEHFRQAEILLAKINPMIEAELKCATTILEKT
jgi:PAS domain S-box-containing protein